MIVFLQNRALKNPAQRLLHSIKRRDAQKPCGYMIDSQGEAIPITDQVVLKCINESEPEGHYPDRWAILRNKLQKKPFLKLLTFS